MHKRLDGQNRNRTKLAREQPRDLILVARCSLVCVVCTLLMGLELDMYLYMFRTSVSGDGSWEMGGVLIAKCSRW